MRITIVIVLSILFLGVFSENFLKDNFLGDWQQRWTNAKRDGLGKFVVQDGGLKTSEDARFYAISSPLSTTLNTNGKTLVVQFVVKHPQGIDCGGGYLKIVRDNLKQEDFKGESYG